MKIFSKKEHERFLMFYLNVTKDYGEAAKILAPYAKEVLLNVKKSGYHSLYEQFYIKFKQVHLLDA